eukprot:CAMPEP_0185768562 /NCGR_PEP_ID=MMETSP1174-20130828/50558_1 /TAXON_ID=35687 /ORGANISM="Dictyocha speculum, Strain CCMP1381" /LENGTH=90 /DNA_ID=CAMNT_0028453303 /DNA_START=261 /DNA_END=533 /DNA_ORIENTATION=+
MRSQRQPDLVAAFGQAKDGIVLRKDDIPTGRRRRVRLQAVRAARVYEPVVVCLHCVLGRRFGERDDGHGVVIHGAQGDRVKGGFRDSRVV